MSAPQRQTEHFELLLEVGRLLSSKLELQELLTTVMQLAARVVNAETASLLLVDLKTNELYFHVALGLPEELAHIRLKMGEGICGSVAASGKPLIINDVRKDPRWTSKVDDDSGFVTRSILAAPINLKGRCMGVVEAINHIDGDFSFTDLRMFEAFASQAGVAIENARLFTSLQEEKSKLNTLLDEMGDAALLTDGHGGVLVANDAARRFMGRRDLPATIDEAVGGLDLTPPLDKIIGSQEDVLEFEATRESPQKLILSGTASLVKDGRSGDVSGRVVVFRDVTDERREEGLKRNFLSLISHKLKTPLASVTGYSQLLLDTLKRKGETGLMVSGLGNIQVQGQKLSGLVDKLLNYTVLEELDAASIEKTEFQVGPVLEDAVKSMGALLEELKAEVVIKDGERVMAVGDSRLVGDVVKNLIENGAKFAREGSRSVTVWAEQGEDGARIHVRDTGPGIAPEEREKIFDKFYQIDTSFTGQIEGWGLGLSFVLKVVAELGGSVSLDSKVGEGTTFTVTFPAPEAS
ncbi:ATP-binding protein [Elusimicrobiota bacterium]